MGRRQNRWWITQQSSKGGDGVVEVVEVEAEVVQVAGVAGDCGMYLVGCDKWINVWPTKCQSSSE